MNLKCKSLGYGSLSDPGIPNVKRIILGPATESLYGLIDFVFPAYQLVDFTVCSLFRKVHGIFFKEFSVLG